MAAGLEETPPLKTVVGVMGSGQNDDPALLDSARALGAAIAREGWVLLNGGRDCGVMAASAEGAATEGGLVIGVLPDSDAHHASRFIDVAILTGMGEARNVVNVLSSDVVVAMRGGAGTLSEVALALKAGRTVVTLDFEVGVAFEPYRTGGSLVAATSVESAIELVRRELEKGHVR